MNIRDPQSIPDVQATPDSAQARHRQGGHQGHRDPRLFKDRSGGEQHTIATFSMYVYLPHNFKGTHMSRFVEIDNSLDHRDNPAGDCSSRKMPPSMTWNCIISESWGNPSST